MLSTLSDGDRAYLFNGKLHCEDGPAIIRASGKVEYYLNDKKLTKSEWEIALKNE